MQELTDFSLHRWGDGWSVLERQQTGVPPPTSCPPPSATASAVGQPTTPFVCPLAANAKAQRTRTARATLILPKPLRRCGFRCGAPSVLARRIIACNRYHPSISRPGRRRSDRSVRHRHHAHGLEIFCCMSEPLLSCGAAFGAEFEHPVSNRNRRGSREWRTVAPRFLTKRVVKKRPRGCSALRTLAGTSHTISLNETAGPRRSLWGFHHWDAPRASAR